MDQGAADEALLTRLASGDRAALGLLYDQYAGVLLALLLRIVHDRAVAEELLQEVFLRVWQRATTYQAGRARVLTWLMGITHNLAIDEIRRQQRRPQAVQGREPIQLLALPSGEAGPDELAWLRQQRQYVHQALAQLPVAQRTIIELAYFGGYTQSQIATHLGQPLGTVKTRLRLGLQKLREELLAQGLGPPESQA